MTDNGTPLVSVGIPFYNAEKYLPYAIESVILQRYTNWELILIDDGSSDDSLKIAQEYARYDSRITVMSDGINKGLPTRLNELSAHIQGEFYARMDADDMMHPDRISTQLEYLVANPEVDLVGSALISIDNKNRIIGIRSDEIKSDYTLNDIVKGGWSVHPTISGKSNWFKKHQYDTELMRAQDYDLWLRTVKNSVFKKLSTPLLYYREASTPSLKKYFVSTRHGITIYWKNRKNLGIFRFFKLLLNKLLKLLIYFILSLFGNTDFLVKRRSKSLDETKMISYDAVLNKIVQSTGNNLKQV